MRFDSIKAVTFDAAHTLYHPYPSVGAIYREVMQRHGLAYPADQLQEGFKRAFRCVSKDRSILDGERREWSYWKSIVGESISHFSPPPEDFDALFEDIWEEFSHGDRWRAEPTAAATLDALRKRGYQTALLTNWDSRVRQVVEETGFSDKFDALFISSEIGFEKPDPKIFQHCQRELNLAPHEILHVGDSLQHDIEGARNSGWHALRICGEEEKTSSASNVPTIKDISETLRFLRV
ncbi:HAD-IA family hydrolase [Pelagicoccus albus]|uniref:HAD-IA family hydrolase n=1 Tax=Pelagicoccus albus TaxID=415222 RepID=A0A7X1EA76_9BACT|nr:HAD-IA family hydrolase [Pelagicoccus albus]MBC2608209.1 HAD-IA family hydrolase [Pelagicoccus albus]